MGFVEFCKHYVGLSGAVKAKVALVLVPSVVLYVVACFGEFADKVNNKLVNWAYRTKEEQFAEEVAEAVAEAVDEAEAEVEADDAENAQEAVVEAVEAQDEAEVAEEATEAQEATEEVVEATEVEAEEVKEAE